MVGEVVFVGAAFEMVAFVAAYEVVEFDPEHVVQEVVVDLDVFGEEYAEEVFVPDHAEVHGVDTHLLGEAADVCLYLKIST